MSSLRSRHNARYVDVVGLVHARVHGGCPMDDQPPWTDQHWVNGGEDLEVKLKDYLDGATVLFDAAGNVVDGRLQGDSSPWVISPRGVEVSFTWSDLSNKKFVGVGFTEDTSRKILDLLTRLHQANSPDATSHCQVPQ